MTPLDRRLTQYLYVGTDHFNIGNQSPRVLFLSFPIFAFVVSHPRVSELSHHMHQ